MEGRKYPREYLVAEIKRVARELGERPTMAQFDELGRVAAVTVAKRFNVWMHALGAAGFDAPKPILSYTDSALRSALVPVSSEIGRTPTMREFEARCAISASTVRLRLGGSWAAACKSAGLLPRRHKPRPPATGGWNKGHRSLQLPEDELAYLYEVEGLSASSIAQRVGSSRGTVLRALREQGIAVKRLHYSMPRETTIESMVYQELEQRNVPFARRQVVDGLYEVDAIIMGARIVIECDGEYWHSLPGRPEKDAKRDRYLESRGYLVLRFTESEIKHDVESCGQIVVDALVARLKG